MPQVRVEKKDHFTRIDNGLIQNPEISLKAKGLLAYMLSLPDDWDYSISGLSVKCKEGKSSIRGAITELMEHRYITRSLARDENGRIGGYEYVVYEEPQPSCENPTTDNPSSENRTQQTTNSTNEKKTNTPYSPPAGDSAPAEAATEDKPVPEKKSRRFVPPDVEQVRAYCRERGNNIDPEAFVDYYASKGWTVGRAPMKDWKAAVRTWEQRRRAERKAADDEDDWFQ